MQKPEGEEEVNDAVLQECSSQREQLGQRPKGKDTPHLFYEQHVGQSVCNKVRK